MKYVLVIGDGMADNPVPELGSKTPLQYAKIPAIDALAAKGELGSVTNCPEGLPPGSDTAILSIFGADPRVCYTGRAPLEAAATGIRLEPGDVAYRCNMIALEDADKPFAEKKILSHSGGSIDGEDSIALVEYLFAHPGFKAAAEKAGMKVYPAASFRHIAVQKGADIKGIVLIPPHDHLGEVIGPLLPSGCPNAEVLRGLMELANTVLDRHPINEARRAGGKLPANGVWFWAEGTAVALDSFYDKFHKAGTVVSAVPLCQGIARLTGWTPPLWRAPPASWRPITRVKWPPPWMPSNPAWISSPFISRRPTNAPTTATPRESFRPSNGWTAAWWALWPPPSEMRDSISACFCSLTTRP
jgi:2,3-bisphosphoglycerate-independent phosphoglycerate mutase